MQTEILVDAGPLVSMSEPRDRHHHWAVEVAKRFPMPWFTVEPVLTEAAFILSKTPESVFNLLSLVTQGALRVDLAVADESAALEALMRRYHDVPMSLADACLVRLSERVRNGLVLTLDRDFNIYRRHRTRRIPLIAPF